jgi:3-oxoacyl-[acyl-carrier-protein] synthase III
MDGRTIILQAARKIPRAISELLERNRVPPAAVEAFLMHQANLNLITRVAQALAAAEWRNTRRRPQAQSSPPHSEPVCIGAPRWP